MIRRTVCVVLLAFALVSCRTAPNQLDEDQTPRSRYAGEAGESPVGVIPEGTLRDTERGKDVVFTVEYPTRPGPYPLIIFSHGFGATRGAYVGLSSHWASQGYVVIKPAHADSGKLQRGSAAEAWRDQTPGDWRNRVRDITAIIDSLDRIEETYPELKGKVDRAKISVAGHSYGAFTAMLIGGAKTFPGATSYADARVKAIVVMSPQGPSETFGLTADSFKDIRVPTLFMTGSEDRGLAESETPEWRRQAYELSSAGDKWLVVLQGARHASFVGRIDPSMEGARLTQEPMLGEPPARTAMPREQYDPRRPGREGRQGLQFLGVFGHVKALSLAFFDAYLRSDAEGRTALEAAGSRGGVELLRK